MFVSVADKLSITLYAKKFSRKLHDLFEDRLSVMEQFLACMKTTMKHGKLPTTSNQEW